VRRYRPADVPSDGIVGAGRVAVAACFTRRTAAYASAMSVFTDGELEYLRTQTMGRLATIGRDGRPHIVPLTYAYNEAEDTIDLGGIDFASGKKWRDAKGNPNVTFLIDDFSPEGAHAVEIRGDAELHEQGGSQINPRFPNFVEQFIRLRPRHIVSWGVDDEESGTGAGFRVNSRSVS
jgi:pyridoxamine 5'-phosphate oxidase family protein